jgi:hypothetical protein
VPELARMLREYVEKQADYVAWQGFQRFLQKYSLSLSLRLASPQASAPRLWHPALHPFRASIAPLCCSNSLLANLSVASTTIMDLGTPLCPVGA